MYINIIILYIYIYNVSIMYYIILFNNNSCIIYPSTANRGMYVLRFWLMCGQIGHAMVVVAVKYAYYEVLGE